MRRGGALDLCACATVVAALLGLAVMLSRVETVSGRVRVVDGDTIELAGRRIRLKGIDAPELAQTCERETVTYSCGEVARSALRDLIGASAVTCNVSGDDKYGRALATCSAGDRDLGAVLVRRGLAVSNGGYLADQADAQAERQGLWAGRFERPEEWRRAHRGGHESSRPDVRLRTSAVSRLLACSRGVPACGEVRRESGEEDASGDEAL